MRAAGNQVLTGDKEGMDSRWILEPGDDLGRALVVMTIKGRRGKADGGGRVEDEDID